MTSHSGSTTAKDPSLPVASRRIALCAGAVGYVAGVVVMVWAIMRSPSSTAPIGFLFVPFVAFVPGVIALLLGCTASYVRQWWKTPARKWNASIATAATSFIVLFASTGFYLANNLRVAFAVAQVASMDAAGLTAYFHGGSLRQDRFVLGAIAQNGAADRSLLHSIALSKNRSLHEGMGSWFPLLGENRRGFAVMRLVARHENTDSDTLRLLSRSPDSYVLGDVAGNPKTPVEILRELHTVGGYLIEWGLARNLRTPSEILNELAASANEFTRASVARNRSTRPNDLDRLMADPTWHVRRSVAMNEAATDEQLAQLANDANEQVGRTARARLARR